MAFTSLFVLPNPPSRNRPLALPRTLTHGTSSCSQKSELSAAVRGSRRLLGLEEREGPWHLLRLSDESTTLTKMIFEALNFERENLSARRGDRHSVGKCAGGEAVGRVARTVCVRGHEWPRMSAYHSRRNAVK